MKQNDFQKIKYIRCRKCGAKNPLTATNCQNYSCGADLMIYGVIGDSKAPDWEDRERRERETREEEAQRQKEQDELWQKAQEEQRRKAQEDRERREREAREQEAQRQRELEEKQRREQELQQQKELEEKQRPEQEAQRQKQLKKQRRRLRVAEFAYVFAMIWAFFCGIGEFTADLPIVGIVFVLIGFILIIPLKKTNKRRKEIDAELSGLQDRSQR